MLAKKVEKLLNEQIAKELYSAYLYLDFADHYEDQGLEGFANWYEVQAKEEMDHAMMFRRYLLDNDCSVVLESIAKPDKKLEGTLIPLEEGLKHEQYVTSLITAIYQAASEEKDIRTMQFLDWFVKEQMEEEKNASDLIKKMKLYATDAKGLYLLNQELAARVYTAPAAQE